MSTNISPKLLMNFISNTLGIDKLSRQEAARYDVSRNDFAEIDDNSSNYLDLDEMLDNKELYSQFASMYEEAVEKDNEVNNEDREKEEALKVKDKGHSMA